MNDFLQYKLLIKKLFIFELLFVVVILLRNEQIVVIILNNKGRTYILLINNIHNLVINFTQAKHAVDAI